jgi:predicted CoA-binding protein
MSSPTVAIIGASRDRSKFGNKSVRAHQAAGYQVYPVHPKETDVEGLECYPSLSDVPVKSLDRISLYLPPAVAVKVLDEIADREVGEIWLNPGVADEAVRTRAAKLGLNVIEGCSIVDLGMSPSQFP